MLNYKAIWGCFPPDDSYISQNTGSIQAAPLPQTPKATSAHWTWSGRWYSQACAGHAILDCSWHLA